MTGPFEPAIPGYQNIEDDNSKPVWRTSRKTKLTLRQINKLRRMIDVRNHESELYLKRVRTQYGPKEEGSGDSTPSL